MHGIFSKRLGDEEESQPNKPLLKVWCRARWRGNAAGEVGWSWPVAGM